MYELTKYRYFEEFVDFWLPIYKRQVFNSKFNNEKENLIAIGNNIIKNWNLTKDEKEVIIRTLGIKYLEMR